MAQEEPGDLLAADIQVRGDDGRWHTVALHEAATTDIIEAARRLEAARMRRPRMDKQLRAGLKRLSERMPQAPRGLGRGERVRVRKGSDGRAAVTFVAVPVDKLEEFLETVRAELLGAVAGGDE